jgi:hypothetical protein
VTYGRSVVFSDFLPHQENCPPLYNLNIVESDLKLITSSRQQQTEKTKNSTVEAEVKSKVNNTQIHDPSMSSLGAKYQ